MRDLSDAATAILQRMKAPLLRSAKLFSVDGRMVVTILELSDEVAVATTVAPPPAGSIAVIARNGLRVSAMVDWVDGQRFALRLDAPLAEPVMERFAGEPIAVRHCPA